MRLIDAEAFLDFLRIEEKIMEGEEITFDYVRSLIVSAPTIEAKPGVHAHWKNYNDMFPCQCSNCNGFALYFDIGNYQKEIESDFCPHCGARMDELVSNTNKLKCSEKPNSSVKIPVISMEDVPKIMEEKE